MKNRMICSLKMKGSEEDGICTGSKGPDKGKDQSDV